MAYIRLFENMEPEGAKTRIKMSRKSLLKFSKVLSDAYY